MMIRIRYRHLDTGLDAEAVMSFSEDLDDKQKTETLKVGLERIIKFLFDAECIVTIDYNT